MVAKILTSPPQEKMLTKTLMFFFYQKANIIVELISPELKLVHCEKNQSNSNMVSRIYNKIVGI